MSTSWNYEERILSKQVYNNLKTSQHNYVNAEMVSWSTLIEYDAIINYNSKLISCMNQSNVSADVAEVVGWFVGGDLSHLEFPGLSADGCVSLPLLWLNYVKKST